MGQIIVNYLKSKLIIKNRNIASIFTLFKNVFKIFYRGDPTNRKDTHINNSESQICAGSFQKGTASVKF